MTLSFMIIIIFFCFKQKTAYEMRISDWSSDVCSSDLHLPNVGARSIQRTARIGPRRCAGRPLGLSAAVGHGSPHICELRYIRYALSRALEKPALLQCSNAPEIGRAHV